MNIVSFKDLWGLRLDYSVFKMSRNPFSITPLFSDYDNKERCKMDEGLFVVTKESRDVVISFGLGKRIITWGKIGVGKTTLLNMLLYLARFRESCLPIRVIIKEDNVGRAVQELLYTCCFELVNELKRRKITEPLRSAKRWLLDKRYTDRLYDFMCRLIGAYEEGRGEERKVSVAAGVSAVLEAGMETEDVTIKSFRTYVENLPVKMIEEYLKEICKLVKELGYDGIVFALDEADHIPSVEKVLGMLTVSREIFFASTDCTFILAGSPDILAQDKKNEIVGIFDSIIEIKSLRESEIMEAFSKRLKSENEHLTLNDVFAPEAIKAIMNYSGGVLKVAIKLAENALGEAASLRECPVSAKHINAAFTRTRADIAVRLPEHMLQVLRALHELGEASPSDKTFQAKASLSRSRLTLILGSLYEEKLVERLRKGRKIVYKVPPQVIPLIS